MQTNISRVVFDWSNFVSNFEPVFQNPDDAEHLNKAVAPENLDTDHNEPGERALNISVVVLSKDEPDLEVTLELLRPQCESLGAECVVVDASESRLESIRQAHPWVTWINYSGPFWRSSTIPHQRNAGCRATNGEIIAFCDAGAEPDEHWLSILTTPLRNGTRTLVCGPVYAKKVGVYSVMNGVSDGAIVLSAPSGNMAFLKTVFEQVGGFDEQLYCGSNLDFLWRCADAGHSRYQVRGAAIHMDFGNSSLSLRRSWRNGRAWVQLYLLHPKRHHRMIREVPERVIFPLWILLGPLAIFAMLSRKLRWATVVWLSVPGLLIERNRKCPRPHRIVADHIVSGVSVLNETARQIIGEMPPVIFIPHDQTPYLRNLSQSLKSEGIAVSLWREPTRSATLNIILGPMWVFALAWRGVKIIHIHWAYNFSRSSDFLFGRIARWWFGIFLASAHFAGLKIVWSAHNLLPHEPIFDDDLAARRVLASRADAIIALSAHGANEISDLLGATNIMVIPLGPIELPLKPASRDAMRETWDVGTRTCFTFFGSLRSYKGLETLIAAAERLGSDILVIITGQGQPEYVQRLGKMVSKANASGADIRFDPRWRRDDELAEVLAGSDVCVFPFVHVDNSGSILLTLLAGLPVIIPDLDSLRHIDNAGVLRFDRAGSASALADVMVSFARLDASERAELSRVAREWALELRWPDIARATAVVYARAVREN